MRFARGAVGSRAVFSLVVVVGALAAAGASQGPAGGWIGPDGEPLPLRTHEAAVEFLQRAEVVGMASVPVGVTRPRKVRLRWNGIESNGIFRTVDAVHRNVRLSDGQFRVRLIDRADHEVAAYRMAHLLGLDNVPPTVERKIGGEHGTVQLWIENARRLEELYRQGEPPPGGGLAFQRRLQMMYLFDDVIGNDDRNRTNILIDDRSRYWMVLHHTRAFQIEYSLQYVAKAIWVERTMWEGLEGLDRETVVRSLEDLVSPGQVDALFERREQLVRQIRGLLERRGTSSVFFDWAGKDSQL